jgi:hypothetical protein
MGLDGLPDDLKKADWHFQPAEFVRAFSRCGWLDRTELAQCFPRKHLVLNGTTGEVDAQGHPKKKFFLKDPPWVIQVPLEKQRP